MYACQGSLMSTPYFCSCIVMKFVLLFCCEAVERYTNLTVFCNFIMMEVRVFMCVVEEGVSLGVQGLLPLGDGIETMYHAHFSHMGE